MGYRPGRPPRILHYLCSEVRGGIEEHALSLLLALPEYGFQPYLAAPTKLLAAIAPELHHSEVKAFPIRRSSPYDFRDARAFVSLLQRERIDLVHSHLFIGSMFASPLAKWAGVRSVFETFHLREVWREGKALKGSFWIDRRISRWVDRYIAVSQANADHLNKTKGIDRAKIRVIYNGRDLRRFRPSSEAEIRIAKDSLGVTGRPVLLVLGRLEPQKGHSFLMEAVAEVSRFWRELVVLIAGTGQLEAEMKAQCGRLGITRQVRFLGYRPDPELLLSAADLVVLPSLFEGLPLAAIEALAAARPLIATDIDGTREVVIDGETGLLVPPRDSEALAGAIARLLRFPELRGQLAMNGRRLVEANFDVRRQIAATMALYRDMLSPPPTDWQRPGRRGSIAPFATASEASDTRLARSPAGGLHS